MMPPNVSLFLSARPPLTTRAALPRSGRSDLVSVVDTNLVISADGKRAKVRRNQLMMRASSGFRRTLSLGRGILFDFSAAALGDGLVESRRPDRNNLDGLLRADAGNNVASVWEGAAGGSSCSASFNRKAIASALYAQTGLVNSSPLASILTTSLIIVASSLARKGRYIQPPRPATGQPLRARDDVQGRHAREDVLAEG